MGSPVPVAFTSPLSGNETWAVSSSNGGLLPSSQSFLVSSGQIMTAGGVASGSFTTGASNTTLANITGMSATLLPGVTYIVYGYLACVANATAGIKLALTFTGTTTLFVSDTWAYNTSTLTAEQNAAAVGTIYSAAGAVTVVEIGGTIIVGTGGKIQLQAAQSVSNATPCTITNGSFITFTPINV